MCSDSVQQYACACGAQRMADSSSAPTRPPPGVHSDKDNKLNIIMELASKGNLSQVIKVGLGEREGEGL